MPRRIDNFVDRKTVGEPLPLSPYDKARMQMTQAEYKAWVERGVWPERVPYPHKNKIAREDA